MLQENYHRSSLWVKQKLSSERWNVVNIKCWLETVFILRRQEEIISKDTETHGEIQKEKAEVCRLITRCFPECDISDQALRGIQLILVINDSFCSWKVTKLTQNINFYQNPSLWKLLCLFLSSMSQVFKNSPWWWLSIVW